MRRKPFAPPTSDSRHGFLIVPNLLRGLVPSGLDQIWVADITYIRLREAFGYLAVILDGFSRKVVGWALAPHLDASLAVEALDHALADRKPTPASLIHHSDRGVQGGFKWSSQQLDEGGCDEHSKAAFGSIWAGTIVVTRSTAGCRPRRAATLLGSDRGRDGK
jgi:transposase InsO family protein